MNSHLSPDESGLAQLLARLQSHESNLSDKEREILALLDQEEETRLERALIESQADHADEDYSDLSEAELAAQLIQAEKEALEARAEYLLRNKIIQNVLIADPILKAVHAAPTASHLEKNLHAGIIERDILSMIHGTISNQLSDADSHTADAERELIELNAKNQALAGKMLGLAEALKADNTKALNDESLEKEIEDLDHHVREARREWRVMKGVVSGVVAGSGVDWANDPRLLELVLDEDEDTV